MKAPRFWWRDRRTAVATLLAPIAGVYGSYAGRRMRRKTSYQAPVPVICVGSFTVGGDGKTPAALAIGAIAAECGLNPGFLTRGYGGTATGPWLVDLLRDDPRITGDEPRLLAALGPTVISPDRPAGARLLAETGVDLIVMDDGFQNPYLGKNLSLVVADAMTGLGNRMVTPAGPLRAPLAAQLHKADLLLLVGDGEGAAAVAGIAADFGKPLWRAKLVPDEPQRWHGAPVHAFAAIGRPEKFFASLERAGARIVRRSAFPDHHYFTEEEARALLRGADAAGARLVTTAKDHARLGDDAGALGELRRRSQIFAVHLEFEKPRDMQQLIQIAVSDYRAGKRRSAGD
jgi:tetraacyldisaccharide 4'-kinase